MDVLTKGFFFFSSFSLSQLVAAAPASIRSSGNIFPAQISPVWVLLELKKI
jgi:hypothetical protein